MSIAGGVGKLGQLGRLQAGKLLNLYANVGGKTCAPIAMGNALPPVQEQAHFVTASNEEDGVAKAIATIILPRAVR